MEQFFLVLYNTGHETPNLTVLVVLIVLALVLPPLINSVGRKRAGDPKRKKARHVAPTSTVLENELLNSDQSLRNAIAAYEAVRQRR